MPIIEVKNISKKYNIVHQKNGSRYITLRDVLTNLAKHPFKSAKNIMKQKLGIGIEEFWALKNINFSVEKGEVLGIIGPNGAGKSTLLKILSQITPPTTGEIKMKGRVGSLLEVGTGFNPELTGRENVYLNGAILGMTKKEIHDKFNNIVEFSGVEKFIDTPVKRYSSGMIVRLGFSVAAHLEPDILLVDEVLAVGDADFRRKSLQKMLELVKGNLTILFVSHNLRNIEQLCNRVIYLESGKIKSISNTNKAITQYLSNANKKLAKKNLIDVKRKGSGEIRYSAVEVKPENNSDSINFGDSFVIKAKFKCFKPCKKVRFRVGIQDQNTELIITLASYDIENLKSDGEFTCKFSELKLRPRTYSVYLSITDLFLVHDQWWNAAQFTIHGSEDKATGFSVGDSDIIYTPTNFQFNLTNKN